MRKSPIISIARICLFFPVLLLFSGCSNSSGTSSASAAVVATMTITQHFSADGFALDYAPEWTSKMLASDIYSFAATQGVTQLNIHVKAIYFDANSMVNDLTSNQTLTCNPDNSAEQKLLIDGKTFFRDGWNCTNKQNDQIKLAVMSYVPPATDNSQPSTERNQIVIVLESRASDFTHDNSTYFQPILKSLSFS